MKNIVAKADVEESFDKEVAIYDLNEFLASISLFTSPILEFNDEHFVTIKEEKNPKNSLKYFYSDPSVVTSPSKTITMPSKEVSFTLNGEDLNKLKFCRCHTGTRPSIRKEKYRCISNSQR